MDTSHPSLRGPVPFVMAHRGFDLDGLENTMRAFEGAVRLGVTFLETDVHATSDGVLVAFHDPVLDRLTDRRGQVARLPWREVSAARVGGVEPIPRLEDALAAWPDVRFNIDIKAAPAVEPFVAAIRRTASWDRIVVASFSDRRRSAAVRGLAGEGPVAWSPGSRGVARIVTAVGRAERAERPGRAGRPGRADRVLRVRAALNGAACVQLPERLGGLRLVTPRLVDVVHQAGAQVHVWTVDDPAAMARLFDVGVDSIVTNRSDLALAVIETRGSAGESA